MLTFWRWLTDPERRRVFVTGLAPERCPFRWPWSRLGSVRDARGIEPFSSMIGGHEP